MKFSVFTQKLLTWLLLASYTLTACGLPGSSVSTSKAIIDKDDRTVIKSPVSVHPVAILRAQEKYGPRTLCYATLTSPDILTTAAHCLEFITFEHQGKRYFKNEVFADFDYAEKRRIAGIVDVFEDLDLVQLRLESPLLRSELAPGRVIDSYDPIVPLTLFTAPHTILESVKVDPNSPSRFDLPQLTTIGFPYYPWDDEEKFIKRPVWVQYSQSSDKHSMDHLGFISYDLDTTPGYSGAPLLQNDRLIGIHLGYDRVERKNIGIALTSLYSPFLPERETKLNQISGEGLSINKIKNWTKELTQDPIKTLGGTLSDLDPSNPGGSFHPSTAHLRDALRAIDISSPSSDFRKALGRIDPRSLS